VVGTPDPSEFTALFSTRCTSSKNCWAVGIQEKNGGNYRNEILHWNGKKWSVQ
jgi:hypothetical protein